ncbi:hypothetical protein BC830DRAFT_1171328 [Chytriomyces sp. MP71]|nr:hypothetical protein BC830DRAFT_1171328 [Chytriomyces sp. MP71]
MIPSVLFAAALATRASAHFEMLNPLPRNVGSMAQQAIAPCAGPVTTPQDRVPYSTLNNSLVMTFYWDGSNDIYLAAGSNPSTFPYKVGALPNATAGNTYQVPLDLSKVPADVLSTGSPLTIQVICHQPDEDIYQCADVTFDKLGLAGPAKVTVLGTPQPPMPMGNTSMPMGSMSMPAMSMSISPTAATSSKSGVQNLVGTSFVVVALFFMIL